MYVNQEITYIGIISIFYEDYYKVGNLIKEVTQVRKIGLIDVL